MELGEHKITLGSKVLDSASGSPSPTTCSRKAVPQRGDPETISWERTPWVKRKSMFYQYQLS